MRGAIIENNIVTNVIRLPDDFDGKEWNGKQLVVSDTAAIGDSFEDGEIVKAPADVIEETLEEKRASARLPAHDFIDTLEKAGLLEAAEDYANQKGGWFKHALNRAPEFHRTNEKLVQAARDMGVSEAQLDGLFGID